MMFMKTGEGKWQALCEEAEIPTITISEEKGDEKFCVMNPAMSFTGELKMTNRQRKHFYRNVLYNWRASGPLRRRMVWKAKRLQRYIYSTYGMVLPLNKAGRLVLPVKSWDEFNERWQREH